MAMYEDLVKTANQCGLKIISDDFCAKLLAWLLYCGNTEAVVYNEKLRIDIMEAQRRLNCYGGEIPNQELEEKLKKYSSDFGDWNFTEEPSWVSEIKIRYNL